MKERFEKFTNLIMEISRSIQKIKNVEMQNLGLKGKQVQCLYTLYNCDGASATDLARLCGEDKGAMSRTVKELEMSGLVFVDENAEKKYRNPIKLTSKGKDIGKIVSEKISGMFKLVSQGITASDREKLYENLTKILDNLNNICENYRG